MKFKINDIEWKIIEVDAENEILFFNNKLHYGVAFAGLKKQIFLNKDMKLDLKRHVLLHELTHAFLADSFLKYKCKFDEEEVCEIVALCSPSIHRVADLYFVSSSVKNRALSSKQKRTLKNHNLRVCRLASRKSGTRTKALSRLNASP